MQTGRLWRKSKTLVDTFPGSAVEERMRYKDKRGNDDMSRENGDDENVRRGETESSSGDDVRARERTGRGKGIEAVKNEKRRREEREKGKGKEVGVHSCFTSGF